MNTIYVYIFKVHSTDKRYKFFAIHIDKLHTYISGWMEISFKSHVFKRSFKQLTYATKWRLRHVISREMFLENSSYTYTVVSKLVA